MDITFFIRSERSNISIWKHYRPLIAKIGETEDVKYFHMPSSRFSICGILKNMIYTYKHRNKNGINHITGECHYIILALLGCKTVLTIHDLGFYTNEKINPIKRRIMYWLLIYFPIKYATRVIAITDKTRQEILSILPFKKRIDVVKHITIDDFKYAPKIIDKSRYILLHNGIAPRKNLETTLKAASVLGCELIVIRKMTEKQITLANNLNVKFNNVYNLSDEDLVEQYKKADIVCFPTLYEGFGAIILEAQATGRPLITSNIEPMRSIAGNGAYLMNNPQDPQEMICAINKIINNDAYRSKLIEAGLQNASKYTLSNCAKEHIDFYKTLFQ